MRVTLAWFQISARLMQSMCDTRTNRVNRPYHLCLWQRTGVHL